MRKAFTILLLFTIGTFASFAQKDAQFTLFPWAQLYFNPGTAGEQHNTLCFTPIYREQYMGIKEVYYDSEKPEIEKLNSIGGRQILFNMETFLHKLRGGIGISVLSDKNAYINGIGVRLGYAYKLNLPGGRLGIGFQVGFLNLAPNQDNLRYIQENDPIIDKLKEGQSFMDLDFNFGLFYKATNWYAGVSCTQIASTPSLRLAGDKTFLTTTRVVYFHGGYSWVIPWDPSWSIDPQALIKTDLATAQFDLMLIARYNGILWGGLSYRIEDAVSVLFGARPFYNSSNNYLKGLDMGIAYSFTTSKLGYKPKGSFGDIEIMIRYCFDIFKPEVFTGYGSSRNIYKNRY